MSGRVVIRRGTAADAAAVAELHVASLRSSYAAYLPAEALADGLLLGRAEQWRELWPLRLGIDHGTPEQQPTLLLADAGAELLAEAAGELPADAGAELLGFAYLTPEGDGRALLDSLHVRPGRTGHGLGTRLLQATLAEARPAALHLDVLAANVRAVAFYEREGGVRTSERTTVLSDGSEAAEYEYTWPGLSAR